MKYKYIFVELVSGATIARVVAVDKDAGDNGRVFYVITSGNEESRFAVGYESGIVSLVRPMSARPTELEITANDHGAPPRKSTIKLSLALTSGQSSGPPRLLLPNPIARVSEDLQVGAAVLNVGGPAIVNQGIYTIRTHTCTIYIYIYI